MEEKRFYAAIDLGTTNSVIAYGNIKNNKMKPIVLELDRKNETGSTSRSPLLPSAVFYYKNNEGVMTADVGDYAKSRYGTKDGYVVKSVKSRMGVTDQVPLVDEIPDKTPSDVSAQILSYMVKGAKKRLFQQELSDIVITVPASFDSDQCQATITAAKKAGINVENMHDILLYEPKAVIYDFMRMQEEGEIPSNLLSLETDKNVMVFDLGGGTLDVTLHRVGYASEGIIDIKDLAINRYTLLGGDNFDELLAVDMLKKFEDMYGITVSIRRREEVMSRLRKLAEKLKTDLSMAYESARMSELELPDDYEIEVMDINLYDSYAFEWTYTREDVEKILAPLLGYQYKKQDVDRIQNMKEEDINNIIYPILDVLDKAGKGIPIDAVILNGGMTKFYMIRQRLKEFFGFEPLETSDPDLSVARGAVYYHYCLHKYNVQRQGIVSERSAMEVSEISNTTGTPFRVGTILNDAINIGLRGEYVSQLIPAGTELPYQSEEIRDTYKLDKCTDTIGIELFLGRGKTKNLPNRRIATRTVKFYKSYPAGTPISFRIHVNAMRMMTMEAWITDHLETREIMELDMASLKGSRKTVKSLGTNEKLVLNAKAEMNELKALANRNKNLPKHELNAQIKTTLEAIGQAANPQDFFEPCMKLANECLQSDMLLSYIYILGCYFKDGWKEDQKKQLLSVAKRHFAPFADAVRQSYYVMKRAMEYIAVTDRNFVSFFQEYLDRVPGEALQIRQTLIQYVVLYEVDDEKVAGFLNRYFKVSDLNVWITNALIQRYGRGTSKEHQNLLSKQVKLLSNALKAKDRTSVPPYLAVLIAELCSGDVENPLQNDKYTGKPVWQAVKSYLQEEENEMFCRAIVNIWNGTELTEEEEEARKSAFRQNQKEDQE